MSIASELNRIIKAKNNLIQSLNQAGIVLSAGTKIDNLSAVVVNEVMPNVDTKLECPMGVSVDPVKVGEESTFIVELPSDATGDVGMRLNSQNYYTAQIVGGRARLEVCTNFPAGEYLAYFTYSGDSKYSSTADTVEFEISKIDISSGVEIEVETDDTSADITLFLPEDAGVGERIYTSDSASCYTTSCVIFDVDGIGYVANPTCGLARIHLDDLEYGDHSVSGIFVGDDKYTPGVAGTTFTI